MRVKSGLPDLVYGQDLSKIGMNLFLSDYEGIFLSTDNGESWTSVNSGLTPPFRNASGFKITPVLRAVGDHLFVSTKDGVFVLKNDEATWTPANVGLPENSLVSIDSSTADLFAHTRDAGTWRLRMRKLQGATE